MWSFRYRCSEPLRKTCRSLMRYSIPLERLSGDIEPALIAVLSDIKMPGVDGLQ